MIEVDGASGGGSVLRVAVPLVLARNEPVRVYNIRKSRKKDGLRLQHLLGLQTMAKITGGELKGGEVGSTDITISPGDTVSRGSQHLDISTAASISLIIQILSNYCFASGENVEVEFSGGGTHTMWSPSFDYISMISSKVFQQFGQNIDMQMKIHGFYPRGGAKGRFSITQKNIPRVTLGRDQEYTIRARSIATVDLQSAEVAERQIKGCDVSLHQKEISYINSKSTGTAITLAAETGNTVLGASSLGKRGKPAEKVGKEASDHIKTLLGAGVTVDNHLADQLLVPLAFSPSGSSFSFMTMTDHIRTNLELLEQLDHPLDITAKDESYIVTNP